MKAEHYFLPSACPLIPFNRGNFCFLVLEEGTVSVTYNCGQSAISGHRQRRIFQPLNAISRILLGSQLATALHAKKPTYSQSCQLSVKTQLQGLIIAYTNEQYHCFKGEDNLEALHEVETHLSHCLLSDVLPAQLLSIYLSCLGRTCWREI